MSLLRRLSDGFWQYVSPQKPVHTPLPTPTTEPRFRKPAIPSTRRASIHHLSTRARSISSGNRPKHWPVPSPSTQASASIIGTKRKRTGPSSISPSAGRQGKTPKLESPLAQDEQERDKLENESLIDDEYDDYGEGSSQWQEHENEHESSGQQSPMLEDGIEDDDVSDEDAPTADRRTITLPEEQITHQISTEELRSQGWDDDYITLIQKIAMRGYEPVLPAYMKFEYRFMPDGLFEQTDDAFIASMRKEHFKGSKALDRLLELGGHVRDRIYMDSAVQPQDQVKRQLHSYLKWAFEDAGLDPHTAIPIVALEFQPAGTAATTLRANATRKCRRLAARYKAALRVKNSIESSPPRSSSRASDNNALISYPLPTFYAIIASHAIVAVMAYRPGEGDEEESGVTPMAFFDLKDKNYDVWNALALAIVVCHVRNVQVRIAEETGLGQKQPGYQPEDDSEEDEDLDL